MTELSNLVEIERRALQLSDHERLWLIERLAHSLRAGLSSARPDWTQALAAMAADAEVQRELQQIAREFAPAEMDGLGDS
jgi:hypothetical protein